MAFRPSIARGLAFLLILNRNYLHIILYVLFKQKVTILQVGFSFPWRGIAPRCWGIQNLRKNCYYLQAYQVHFRAILL